MSNSNNNYSSNEIDLFQIIFKVYLTRYYTLFTATILIIISTIYFSLYHDSTKTSFIETSVDEYSRFDFGSNAFNILQKNGFTDLEIFTQFTENIINTDTIHQSLESLQSNSELENDSSKIFKILEDKENLNSNIKIIKSSISIDKKRVSLYLDSNAKNQELLLAEIIYFAHNNLLKNILSYYNDLKHKTEVLITKKKNKHYYDSIKKIEILKFEIEQMKVDNERRSNFYRNLIEDNIKIASDLGYDKILVEAQNILFKETIIKNRNSSEELIFEKLLLLDQLNTLHVPLYLLGTELLEIQLGQINNPLSYNLDIQKLENQIGLLEIKKDMTNSIQGFQELKDQIIEYDELIATIMNVKENFVNSKANLIFDSRAFITYDFQKISSTSNYNYFYVAKILFGIFSLSIIIGTCFGLFFREYQIRKEHGTIKDL